MCGRSWPRISDSWPISFCIRASSGPGKPDPGLARLPRLQPSTFSQAARDPLLDPPPFRGRKSHAARSRLDVKCRAAGLRPSPPERGRDGVGVCGLSERSDNAAQRGVEDQAREQDQAGVAVGLEHLEAVVRIADIQPRDLPGEMGGEGG